MSNSKIELINGNCLDIMKDIPKDVFIISDPPYNQKYHYNEYKDNLELKDYKQLLKTAFGENRKSVIILYPEETISLLPTLELGNVQEVVSWVYNSNTAKQHRLISWWNCKPDFRKIPQEYKNPKDKRIAKRIEEGKMARSYDWFYIDQVKNVSKADNEHPCPIPLELAEKMILSTTNEGDTICDPFMGSGTIGMMCKKHGRNFIGIELNDTYFNISKTRINNLEII